MSLATLLDAERQLGRLTEALAAADARALWQADALRREALASCDLDGMMAHWDDVVVAEIRADLLPEALRETTALPLRLIACGSMLTRPIPASPDAPEGLPDDLLEPDTGVVDDGDGDSDDGPAGAAVRAAARGSIADIEAFLRRPTARDDALPRDVTPSAAPLSRDWLAAAWTRLTGQPLPPACLDEVAGIIEDGLQRPGLAGVAAVLHALHRDGLFPAKPPADYGDHPMPAEVGRALTLARAEVQDPGAGWRFARLLAPWLTMRACALPAPGPWLSPALRAARLGYRAAAQGKVDGWSAWLYPALAEGFARERDRLRDLTAILAGWEDRFGKQRRGGARQGADETPSSAASPPVYAPLPKRRWQTSRQVLRLIIDQPAVTTDFLSRRRGISRRAAQMMAKELEEFGILERIHHAKGREWLIATRLSWLR